MKCGGFDYFLIGHKIIKKPADFHSNIFYDIVATHSKVE